MIIYISGPMTKHKDNDYNRAAFYAAEKHLTEQGHIVLNPAYTPDGLTLEQYLRIDLVLVEIADAIYMLKEWEESTGANAEYAHALLHQKQILYEEGLNGKSLEP